jgi:hypothetical protein
MGKRSLVCINELQNCELINDHENKFKLNDITDDFSAAILHKKIIKIKDTPSKSQNTTMSTSGNGLLQDYID